MTHMVDVLSLLLLYCICLDYPGGSLRGGAHAGLQYLLLFFIMYYLFVLLFFCFFFRLLFVFFICFFLLLLPASSSSSWGRLPFLAGEVGCLFLAGEVHCFFWQEVGCFLGRIFFRVVVILRACVGVAVAEFFFFFYSYMCMFFFFFFFFFWVSSSVLENLLFSGVQFMSGYSKDITILKVQ